MVGNREKLRKKGIKVSAEEQIQETEGKRSREKDGEEGQRAKDRGMAQREKKDPCAESLLCEKWVRRGLGGFGPPPCEEAKLLLVGIGGGRVSRMVLAESDVREWTRRIEEKKRRTRERGKKAEIFFMKERETEKRGKDEQRKGGSKRIGGEVRRIRVHKGSNRSTRREVRERMGVLFAFRKER